MSRFERFLAWCEDLVARADHGDEDAHFIYAAVIAVLLVAAAAAVAFLVWSI